MHYQIKLPLADGVGWFVLCTCESPEMVGEVIRILLSADKGTIFRFQIDTINP